MAADPTAPSLDGPRGVLRRRARVIAVCVAVAVLAAIAGAASQEKRYTASAELLFRDAGIDEKLFESSELRATDPNRDAATDVKLVSTRTVADRVARRLGRDEDDVRDTVTVALQGQSNVVLVTAEDASAEGAARTATTFAREFVAHRRDIEVQRIEAVRERVLARLEALPASQREGRVGRTLGREADRLEVLASAQTGDAEVLAEAEVPDAASSPNPGRDIVVAAFLGLLLGLGAALLAERLDRRVRDPEEAAALAGAPLLAVAGRKTGERALQAVRVQLAHWSARPVRTVLVASPDGGGAADEAAAGLVAAAAGAGRRATRLDATADLESDAGRERAGALAASHDLVVISAPGAAERPEAVAAAAVADAVLLVVRVGRTRRDDVAALRDLLGRIGAVTAGVLALKPRASIAASATTPSAAPPREPVGSAPGHGVGPRRED
jgi:capsular polysaccharide biosynthesis protein